MTYSYSEQGPASWRRVVSDGLVMIVSDRDAVVDNMKREGVGDIACLYMLVDTAGGLAYVGETENARARIAQHCKGGPGGRGGGGGAQRIDSFDKVAIVWDGRPIQTTRFSDGAVRKELEARLIRALAGFGMLLPVNSSASGSRANLVQAGLIGALGDEMLFVLHKFGYLKRMPDHGAAVESSELGDEETKGMLASLGLRAVRRKGVWIECEGGAVVYAAAGSRKEHGWQITIRDELLKRLVAGEPNLHVALQRTRACVLPSSFLGPLVRANKGDHTVDIYIDDRRGIMKCGRQGGIDVGRYMVKGGDGRDGDSGGNSGGGARGCRDKGGNAGGGVR